jgi:hypothetical protein
MKTLSLFISVLCCCCAFSFAKTSAIIEDWKTYYILPEANNLTVKMYLKIKVLEEDGYRYAIFQDYYNSFKKIKSIRYTVTDASNKRVKRLSRGDATDMMINPSYEISDARMLVLEPEYRNFPFTVEIEVEASFNGFLGFPQWIPRYTHDLEVRNAELILECYKDFYFRSREFNGVSAPAIVETGKMKTIRWSVKDLPAIEQHISYKSFAADQAKVHVTPLHFSLENRSGDFSSWTNFGEWYRTLNEGRNTISTSTKEFLNGLRQQYGDNTKAISRAVYQFMQGKTRYISIQLGIGGYQTIPSDEVERTGYGDCKALTNYMAAMLEYLNIPTNPVLVKAGRDVPDILHDFPSNQFNHVFLAVPLKTDTLWFECTSQSSPPAYIGTFTDDRYVLWIDKNQSKIIRTPAFDAAESVIASNCIVNIESLGDAQIELKVSQTGMFYDEVLYYENLGKDKIERFNYSKFHYKDFSLQSFNFALPEKDAPVLRLHYKLKVNGLGKPLGTKMIIPSNVLSPLDKSLRFDLMNKKTEIRRSFTMQDSVQILLPDDYRVGLIPEAINESSEFGTFEMQFKTDNKNVLHIYRKAMIKKGTYENATFGRFYEMIQKIKALEQKKIVLQSKT